MELHQCSGRRSERALVVTVWAAMAHVLFGQAGPSPEFEVASIKPASILTPMMMRSPQWHFRMDDAVFDASNATLLELITTAYNINSDHVSGPRWLNDQAFAVLAKLPAGATKERIPAMLEKLLADRFKLAVHHDQKVQQVYLLTVGKDGAKLKESMGDSDQSLKRRSGRPGRYRCTATTMEELAESFTAMSSMYAHLPASDDQRNIDLPVIDQTGLKGAYDIDLQWIPPESAGNRDNGGRRGAMLPPPDPNTRATSIFSAFDTLGLKLQPGKHAFDILVIDHVERTPSEN